MSAGTPGVAWYGRLFHYDAWANGETLSSLRSGNPPAKALRWMAHIIGSGELWLARLRDEPPTLAVWPDLDVDGCAAGIARVTKISRKASATATLGESTGPARWRTSSPT